MVDAPTVDFAFFRPFILGAVLDPPAWPCYVVAAQRRHVFSRVGQFINLFAKKRKQTNTLILLAIFLRFF